MKSKGKEAGSLLKKNAVVKMKTSMGELTKLGATGEQINGTLNMF